MKKPPAKPPIDRELDVRVARARGRANRLEHDLRHDDAALVRVAELQARLRRAVNAFPFVREGVLAACDAIEAFGVGA